MLWFSFSIFTSALFISAFHSRPFLPFVFFFPERSRKRRPSPAVWAIFCLLLKYLCAFLMCVFITRNKCLVGLQQRGPGSTPHEVAPGSCSPPDGWDSVHPHKAQSRQPTCFPHTGLVGAKSWTTPPTTLMGFQEKIHIGALEVSAGSARALKRPAPPLHGKVLPPEESAATCNSKLYKAEKWEASERQSHLVLLCCRSSACAVQTCHFWRLFPADCPVNSPLWSHLIRVCNRV